MTKTAAELRAEAAQMREFALTVTDQEVLAEINLMIEEWERRARLLDNGGATALPGKLVTDSDEPCRRASYFLPRDHR